MRILFISHFIPHPPTGGASQRNYSIIRKLAELGNQITLVSLTQRARHPDRDAEQRSIAALKPLCKELHIFDIPTDSNKALWYGLLLGNMFSQSPYSAWRFWSPAMAREIRRQLGLVSFDIVHYDTIALAPYRRLSTELPGVLNHHNIESTLLLRRSENAKRAFDKWYLRMQGGKLREYERLAGALFRDHIAVSALDRDELLALCPDASISIVPNGTDTDFFTTRPMHTQSRALVFAGSMGWYPNADAMLYFAQELWPLIKRSAYGVTMNLIGAHAPTTVEALGREDSNFKVLGFVDDVRPCIAESAVYVVPIRVGGGTRLKIVDAMAQGKAIVSTTVGAEGLLVRDGHDILLADEPGHFAQRVVGLLNDPSERERLGRNARETAERLYSWNVIVPSLQENYARIATEFRNSRIRP